MTSSMTYEPESLIYTEVADDFPEPTQEEIEEYAKRIGIDVKNEPNLLYLAREGIQAKLPSSWSPCLDTLKNSFYYFNKETLQSQWEHPMDPLYRDKVIRARGELAMNRPPTLQPLNMRLPPVRKSGASLAPIKRVTGSLGSLGGLGPAAGDLRSNAANHSVIPPSSQELTHPTKNGNMLNRHNNANSRNIISGSSLNSFKTSDDDEDTPPLMRPAPKKLGLTLTGGGANFIKGSGPAASEEVTSSKPKLSRGYRDVTPDSDETGAGGDSDKRQIKSILVNSISRSRPANPSENVYELDGFSMNLDEMTEEERMVVSQLDSVSTSKSKGNNVKFNLDDNTELKFEMPGDDDEDQYDRNGDDVEDEVESDNTDEEESSRSNKPAPREQVSDKRFGSGEPTNKQQIPNNNDKNYLNFASEYSETDIEAMKAAMRNEMEAELKKFRDQLEEERKSRQEQIQKHLEETVSQFKFEKDETLKRMRKDMESEKAIEVDKTKREIDNLLQRELEEMKTKFGDALQQRQKELEEENEKKIEALTQEYRRKEEEKLSEVLERQTSEEVLFKMSDNNFRKQKESLEEEHKEQLQQLKEYQEAFLDKVKANLLEEEERLRKDHTLRRAEIVSQFEKETEALKKKLVRSQEEALKKVQDDFDKKRTALEKTLKASLQNVRDLIHQNRRSVSETHINGRAPDDELRSMKVKYQQLETKYHAMQQELSQLTQDVAERKQSSPTKSNKNGNNKQASSPNNSPSKQPVRPTPMKAVGLKNIMERNKNFDASDSAHETNSDSNSSIYPSSDGVVAPSKLHRADTADDPVEELLDEAQGNRINAALQCLEILKKEILELKHANSKTPPPPEGTKLTEKPPPGSPIPTNYRPMSARRAAPKHEDPYPARKRSTTVQLSPKGSKSARVKVSSSSPSPPTHDTSHPKYISRSVSVVPQDFSGSHSEQISEDAHQRIVDAAKDFIRMQKNRLKDPTPIPSSSHLILPTTKNNLLLFDEKLLRSVSPRRPAAIHLDLVSETESSGVSSLKDHRSSESKKLSRDIDEICNSLNSLDQQMKLMWSVVKGKQEQNLQDESYFLNATTTDLTTYLPNTVPMILGKSSRASPSLPTSARKPFSTHPSSTSLQASNTGRNYSSLLSATQNSNSQTVLDALRMSGMSTTRLDCSDLLKSLEEELKEFKSTKQRLLDMQSGPFAPSSHERNHATTTTSSAKPNNHNHTSTILEKTKDLQEWLKKY